MSSPVEVQNVKTTRRLPVRQIIVFAIVVVWWMFAPEAHP